MHDARLGSPAINSSRSDMISGGVRVAGFIRGALIIVATTLAFLLARDQLATPFPSPVAAPTEEFSASRAMRHVEAVVGTPRPQGSEAASAAREYIVRQLQSLGLTPDVQTTTDVRTHPGTDVVFAATVVNVLARIPGTNSSGAIVISGHYDSGPNALGAGDCGSCV